MPFKIKKLLVQFPDPEKKIKQNLSSILISKVIKITSNGLLGKEVIK